MKKKISDVKWCEVVADFFFFGILGIGLVQPSWHGHYVDVFPPIFFLNDAHTSSFSVLYMIVPIIARYTTMHV